MNNIRFKEQTCPYCCINNKESVVEIASDIWYGRGGWFPIVRCNTCNFVFTKIIPDKLYIDYYYPSTYNHYNINHTSINNKKSKLFGTYLESRKLPIEPPASVFEIGASNGAYLNHLLSLGYDAYGLEPSADKILYSPELKLRITSLSFDGEYQFEKKYDLIIAWMVLEHLFDPISCCEKIRSGLTSSGVFVGSVPTMNCLGRYIFGKYWYGYQVPTHFTHFDIESLNKLLIKSGFSTVTVSYQANCLNLLRSMESYFQLNDMKKIARLISVLIHGKNFGKIRGFLSLVLKFSKLSGRIEFVACK